MSAFIEIKGLLTTEIINSPQYAVAVKVKDMIVADILAPNVSANFVYTLEDSDYVDVNNKDIENQSINLALKVVLGLDVEVDMGMIVIPMKKFLL
jgi:hypothetical protein